MGFYCAGEQASPVACNGNQYSGMGASSCSNCADLTTQGKIFICSLRIRIYKVVPENIIGKAIHKNLASL